MTRKLDEKLADIIMGAIENYVNGASYNALTFDLLRGDEPSIEPVFMLLMSQKDWPIIHAMIKVLQHPEVSDKVREKVIAVFEEQVDAKESEV